MSLSDIVGCQPLEDCERINKFLQEVRYSPNDFNEVIHRWMPGVKTVIPLDYFNDFNSACVVIPTTTQGRFYLSVDENMRMGQRVWSVSVMHPNMKYVGEFESQWLGHAIVMASLTARLESYAA
jgi:hypothetical protein